MGEQAGENIKQISSGKIDLHPPSPEKKNLEKFQLGIARDINSKSQGSIEELQAYLNKQFELSGWPDMQPPIEYSPDKFDLTPINIRNADRSIVIKKAAYELDKENPESLSVDVVKALISRAISDNIDSLVQDNPQIKNNTIWPESSQGSFKNQRFKVTDEDGYPVYKGKYLFKEGLYDVDDLDGMTNIAFIAMEHLDDQGKAELTKWILNMHQEIPELGISNIFNFDIKLCHVIQEAQNSDELFKIVMDYVYKNVDQYHYLLPDELGSAGLSKVDGLTSALGLILSENAPKYLEEQMDDEKVKKMLGIWIDEVTFPNVINQFRAYLEKHPSERLEKIGRMLLGENPDDTSVTFHTSLDHIYKKVDFEQYPANLAATEHELDLIMSMIKDGDVILEKGCGTGRISNGLTERLKEKGINCTILAFDSSEENITKAKSSDSSGKVQYFQGSWENIPLKEESVDMIIDLGRNNTHAENLDGLRKALEDPVKVLKKHGKMLVDWPDPDKGEYLENRIKYMNMLRSLNIPVDPQNPKHLKQFAYVLDGPDKQEDGKYGDIYNRFVPQVNTLHRTYFNEGLQMQEVDRQPIVGWKDSENIYFLASKEWKVNPNWTSFDDRMVPIDAIID